MEHLTYEDHLNTQTVTNLHLGIVKRNKVFVRVGFTVIEVLFLM